MLRCAGTGIWDPSRETDAVATQTRIATGDSIPEQADMQR